MNIRKATSNDIPDILMIWGKAGLPTRPKGRDKPENIAKQMSQANMWILIGEIEKEIVGVVLVSHDTRKGWINRLATIPEKRRSGIGLKLLEEAEKSLIEAGIEIFTALILEDNLPSRKLFEKANYVCHENVTYYSKRNYDDV